MHHGPKIGAAVGFDDDEVAKIHMESSRFLYVKDVRTAAFEANDIERLSMVPCIRVEAKVSSVCARVNVCLAKRSMGFFATAATRLGASKVLDCKMPDL